VAPESEAVRGIFGVPLITSIPYANVAISLFNESGESYIYGYVPIVVAKCGVFLKEKGPSSRPPDPHGPADQPCLQRPKSRAYFV